MSFSASDSVWMRNVAQSRWMVCVNTNCLLINHRRGHLRIICSSLNVCGCASLFVYLSSEITPLSGPGGRWDRLHKDTRQETGKVAKIGATKKKQPKTVKGNENKERGEWVRERWKTCTLHSWVIHTGFCSAWFYFLQASKHKEMQHYSAALSRPKTKAVYVIVKQNEKRPTLSQSPGPDDCVRVCIAPSVGVISQRKGGVGQSYHRF